jgi:predicted transcriptional regulator
MSIPTRQQVIIMEEMAKNPGPSVPKFLAYSSGTRKSSVTAQLSKLEREDLVLQVEGGWRLTEKGEKCLASGPLRQSIKEDPITIMARELLRLLENLKDPGGVEIKLNFSKDGPIEFYIAIQGLK